MTFVTDRGFLVPSLVAARQLVEQGIHQIADIVIYTIDIDPAMVETLSAAPGNRHIRFEALPARLLSIPDNVAFYKNHVPVAALARLSLPEAVPDRYNNIIYIDGDVQIAGDVSPLVRYRVPDGKLLAGRGSAWLDLPGQAADMTPANYLAELGGVTPQSYFNSGVLACRRETWAATAGKALSFFLENSKICIRHDQSALNAVFRGNVELFSPKYNFHSKYADLYVQRRYAPSIIHFTGPFKPWKYVGPPWGSRFLRSYTDLLREQPALGRYLQTIDFASFPRAAANLARLARAQVQEGRRLIGDRGSIRARRKLFLDYIEQTNFPV